MQLIREGDGSGGNDKGGFVGGFEVELQVC